MSQKIFPSVRALVASIQSVLKILVCRLYSVVTNFSSETVYRTFFLANRSHYLGLQDGVEYRYNAYTEQHNDKYHKKRNLKRVLWERVADDGKEDSI